MGPSILFLIPILGISVGLVAVIGGVIVAPKARDLILPISLAVEHRLTVNQLARSFSVYPARSASVTDSARSPHPLARTPFQFPVSAEPL